MLEVCYAAGCYVGGMLGGVMLGMLEVSGEGVAVRCSVWECAVHTVLLCCVFSRMANGQWQTATAWLQPGG